MQLCQNEVSPKRSFTKIYKVHVTKICLIGLSGMRFVRFCRSYASSAPCSDIFAHLFRPSLISYSWRLANFLFVTCFLCVFKQIWTKLYWVSTKSIPSTGTTKPKTKIHMCFERANQLLSLL